MTVLLPRENGLSTVSFFNSQVTYRVTHLCNKMKLNSKKTIGTLTSHFLIITYKESKRYLHFSNKLLLRINGCHFRFLVNVNSELRLFEEQRCVIRIKCEREPEFNLPRNNLHSHAGTLFPSDSFTARPCQKR